MLSCSWHSLPHILYCPVYLQVDLAYAEEYACAMQYTVRVSMRRICSCLPSQPVRKPSARFVCLKSLSLPYILHLFGSDNPGSCLKSRNYFIAFAFWASSSYFLQMTVCLPRSASKLVLVYEDLTIRILLQKVS